MLTPGTVLAAPAGEQVVSGTATFDRQGATTTITTGTPDTIVNYTNFDIGVHETVQIDQPDAASRILNRVLSTDATQVDGRLHSNGQVWIVNPVGVFFGGQAIVDVGGLVAAAGQVSDADFLGGSERFANLSGDVGIATGALVRADDRVLLVGQRVANHGEISVPNGMVVFAAGDEVRLAKLDGRVVIRADRTSVDDPARYAIEQAGAVDAQRVSLTAGDAYSLAMNHSGVTRADEIELEGGDGGVVRVAGTLDASGRGAGEAGGSIHVLGDLVALEGATLDVSGAAGGGEILVGGDFQGGGAARSARRTYVSPDAVLRADAIDAGDGGRVIVWADEATSFHGSLSARGGAQGGDGGFAEISGKRSLVSRGHVDLGADAGRAGTLLYDPLHIVIRGGTLDGEDAEASADFLADDGGAAGRIAVGDSGGGVDPFVIYESEIEGTDANIVLAAGRSIQSEGLFAGDEVTIMAGRDLSLSVVDDAGALAPGEFLGIDVRSHAGAGDLTWNLSDGGTFTLATTSTDDDRAADVFVGHVVTQGVRAGAASAVSISADVRGDVAVTSITTSGADRNGAVEKTVFGNVVNTLDAGNVSVSSAAGSVTVGSITATGGHATTALDSQGDGGAGGAVVLSASRSATGSGAIDVGAIDVSGGDGRVHLVDDGAGGLTPEGQGGAGGTISLIADINLLASDTVPPGGDTHVVTVTGDLSARGGDGLGTDTLATPPTGGAAGGSQLVGAAGGGGGQVFVSAGTTADEGRVVLGSAGTPITIDASGGDGTAAGGGTSSGGQSTFTGATVGAIRVEAHGDVAADAVLAARGGDAALGSATGPGGFGGLGGNVSIGSDAGDVTLADTGAPAIVATDGGAGYIDPANAVQAGIARFDGQGGSAGSITFETAGEGAAIDVAGALSALGGAGSSGAGGGGGNVTLTALDGPIALAAVNASGGLGFIDATNAMLVSHGVAGGTGGNVFVTTQAGTTPGAVGGGGVLLDGDLVSVGGDGVEDSGASDANQNNGVGGTVRIASVQDVDAAAGAGPIAIRAGTIDVSGNDVFASGGPDLTLESTRANAPADFVGSATVSAAGDLRVLLHDTLLFDRFEVVQRDATGAVSVLRQDGATPIASGTGAPGSPVHTITQLATASTDPHFTYRLADRAIDPASPGGVENIDARTLAVNAGVVGFGSAGGKLANARADATFDEGERLLGHVQGIGAGTHVTSVGNVEVIGTNVNGDTAGFGIDGAPIAEVTLNGDGDLAIGSSVGTLDVVQRRALGNVQAALPGGDSIDITGRVVSTGSSRIETSRVNRVDTTASGIGFFYHLSDATASSGDPGRGEPALEIASGAVTLGGDAGFAGMGDLLLLGAPDLGPPVDAGGNTVFLLADANIDGAGALVASGLALDVADAGALVAFGGEGVGSVAAPLRTSGSTASGAMALAGTGGSGDFHVANTSGRLDLAPVALTASNAGVSQDVSFRGVHADGEVVLDNAGNPISFGAIQPASGADPVFSVVGQDALRIGGAVDGTDRRYGFGDLRIASTQLASVDPNATAPHVRSGGGQRYAGPVELANPATIETTRTDPYAGTVTAGSVLNAVRLEAGGDVVFEGDIDTPGSVVLAGADHTQLVVATPGVTELGGDVGTNDAGAPTIDSLALGRVRLPAGAHAVTAGTADFEGAIDGPGGLVLRGVGPASKLTFRGNVGAGAALASFDADADALHFAVAANRVVAGAIALNTATPTATVPGLATISDTASGLSLESSGDVAIGAREKLSANGPLAIRAGGTASVGDLAATELSVNATSIVIQGRSAAPVVLADGGALTDRGVDWVANAISTNVAPTWDGNGTPPTFVLGSGGIRLGPAPPAFDVVRLDASLNAVEPGTFGAGDPLLDLTGVGPRIVSDARDDLPRDLAPVVATLAARPSGTPPAPAPKPTADQVLGYVRCEREGAPCDAAAAGIAELHASALATERAREIVVRYRDLVASPTGRQRLQLAFAPLAETPPAAEPRDGRNVYRLLRADPALDEARLRVGELAHVLAEISLLGLEPAETERVRRAVAADFAAATAVAGFEAATALAAAEASGVGVLP